MKKGFTLVELIAAITLLAVICIVTFPPIINQLKQKEKEINEQTLKYIYASTESYIKDNKNNYRSIVGNTYCISLQSLVDSNFIKDKITDIKGEPLDLTKVVKTVVTDNGYDFSLVKSTQCVAS